MSALLAPVVSGATEAAGNVTVAYTPSTNQTGAKLYCNGVLVSTVSNTSSIVVTAPADTGRAYLYRVVATASGYTDSDLSVTAGVFTVPALHVVPSAWRDGLVGSTVDWGLLSRQKTPAGQLWGISDTGHAAWAAPALWYGTNGTDWTRLVLSAAPFSTLPSGWRPISCGVTATKYHIIIRMWYSDGWSVWVASCATLTGTWTLNKLWDHTDVTYGLTLPEGTSPLVHISGDKYAFVMEVETDHTNNVGYPALLTTSNDFATWSLDKMFASSTTSVVDPDIGTKTIAGLKGSEIGLDFHTDGLLGVAHVRHDVNVWADIFPDAIDYGATGSSGGMLQYVTLDGGATWHYCGRARDFGGSLACPFWADGGDMLYVNGRFYSLFADRRYTYNWNGSSWVFTDDPRAGKTAEWFYSIDAETLRASVAAKVAAGHPEQIALDAPWTLEKEIVRPTSTSTQYLAGMPTLAKVDASHYISSIVEEPASNPDTYFNDLTFLLPPDARTGVSLAADGTLSWTNPGSDTATSLLVQWSTDSLVWTNDASNPLAASATSHAYGSLTGLTTLQGRVAPVNTAGTGERVKSNVLTLSTAPPPPPGPSPVGPPPINVMDSRMRSLAMLGTAREGMCPVLADKHTERLDYFNTFEFTVAVDHADAVPDKVTSITSGAGDGHISSYDATWAGARGTTPTSRTAYSTALGMGVLANQYYEIKRSFLPFAVALNIVTAATLALTTIAAGSAGDLCLFAGTQASTLTTGDWDAFGTTELAARIATPTTTGGVATFTLNAAGLAYRNAGGTKFCVRVAADVDNIAPTTVSGGSFATSESTTVAWRPTLTETYGGSAARDDASHLTEAAYVSVMDLDGDVRFFTVGQLVVGEDATGAPTKQATCAGIEQELLKTDIAPGLNFVNADPPAVLASMLAGTRWEAGVVESHRAFSYSCKDYASVWENVLAMAVKLGLYVKARVELQGSHVAHFYLDLLSSVGGNTGKCFRRGYDVISMTQTGDGMQLNTAVRGLGKANDDGSYLTVLVEDDDALQLYGILDVDGVTLRHRIGHYVDSECTSLTLLTERAQAMLDVTNAPEKLRTYTVAVASLAEFGDQGDGVSHELDAYRLGDTVTLINDTLGIETAVQIGECVVSYYDPTQNTIAVGAPRDNMVKRLAEAMRDIGRVVRAEGRYEDHIPA